MCLRVVCTLSYILQCDVAYQCIVYVCADCICVFGLFVDIVDCLCCAVFFCSSVLMLMLLPLVVVFVFVVLFLFVFVIDMVHVCVVYVVVVVLYLLTRFVHWFV